MLGVIRHVAGLVIVAPAVIEAFAVSNTVSHRFPETARAVVLAVAVVLPLPLVVIGIPVATWLLVGWFFAPQAVVLDSQTGRTALRRSAESAGVGWHWPRTAGSGLFLLIIGVAPGPIVGLAFLIMQSSSAAFANSVSSLVYVAFLPFSILGLTILYHRRQCRIGINPRLDAPSSSNEHRPSHSRALPTQNSPKRAPQRLR